MANAGRVQGVPETVGGVRSQGILDKEMWRTLVLISKSEGVGGESGWGGGGTIL